MDPAQQTAAEYYKKHRKHSFFSRLTIFSSMAILLIVLAINISVLYSQDKSTTTSHAATPEQIEKLLPSLPQGCIYQHENGKVKVECHKPTPTIATIIPINVDLPKLPPDCSLTTSTTGSKIQCTDGNTPIPTVPVTLPANCTIANKPNSAACKNNSNDFVLVPLPSLPEGCSYKLVANQYFVVCEAK
jgi:hypothetical protein